MTTTPLDDAPEPDADSELTGMPRWVKLVLGVTVALVVLALVIALVAGGEHGPSRHTSGGPVTGQVSLGRGFASLS